jgi:predicted nucleic acid-binding protein
MGIDTIAINASPLILLFASEQADLLPQLFNRIVVPAAVWREIVDAGKDDLAARQLRGATWAIRETARPSPRVAIWNLGSGETAVLSYALAHPGIRAVIDDAAARRCARTLGIPLLGTGGILVLAKRRGLLPSVSQGLNRLRDSGLWLSDDLIRLLLIQAGE